MNKNTKKKWEIMRLEINSSCSQKELKKNRKIKLKFISSNYYYPNVLLNYTSNFHLLVSLSMMMLQVPSKLITYLYNNDELFN